MRKKHGMLENSWPLMAGFTLGTWAQIRVHLDPKVLFIWSERTQAYRTGAQCLSPLEKVVLSTIHVDQSLHHRRWEHGGAKTRRWAATKRLSPRPFVSLDTQWPKTNDLFPCLACVGLCWHLKNQRNIHSNRTDSVIFTEHQQWWQKWESGLQINCMHIFTYSARLGRTKGWGIFSQILLRNNHA